MFRFSTLLLHRPNFIKLTTTMAVMAIVAAMVLPIVNDHAKRGHRARARAALLHAALWMERMATAQGRYPVAAAKGKELAAFMPRRSMTKLLDQANANTGFAYTLDGPLTSNDIYSGTDWNQLALGTGGRTRSQVSTRRRAARARAC